MRAYDIKITYSDNRLVFFEDEFDSRDDVMAFCEGMVDLNPLITDIAFEDRLARLNLEESENSDTELKNNEQ